MNGTDKSETRSPNRIAAAGRAGALHPRAGQSNRRADAARRTPGGPGGRICSDRPDPAVLRSSSTREARSGSPMPARTASVCDDGGVMTSQWLIAARAEALFASDLPVRCLPDQATVTAAIRRAVRAYGVRGCAGAVGAAYGDYPETAPDRMRWARQVIEAVFPPPACASATRQATQPGSGRQS
jgi:hypothetical protein